jgi:hypothetical protein
MSTFAHETIFPVEETLTHKTDVLDWSQLGLKSCDLEFRGNYKLGPQASFAVTLQLATLLPLVSLVAWVLAHPIAIWIAPLLSRPAAAVLSVAAGVAWAVLAEATRWRRTEKEKAPLIEPATLGRLLLPPFLWQAVTLTGRLDLLAGAFQCYVLVSLPLTMLAFDRFATHAVYWITASPVSDHAAMTRGRRAWTWRLLGSPGEHTRGTTQPQTEPDPAFDAVLLAASSYRWGLLWVAVATLAPPTFIAVTYGAAKPTTLGLQLVAGALFGLLSAVLLRSGGDLRIVRCFFRMLVHWFYYGWKDRLPPWVHQSPCGGWLQRQLCVLLSGGLLAVPLTSLAAHSFIRLPEAARTQALMAHPIQPSPDHAAARQSLFSPEGALARSSWLWIAPTVLVAFTIPALNFCLIGILLTGKIILAYEDAFETPLGVPPQPTFPAEDEGDATPTDGGQPS